MKVFQFAFGGRVRVATMALGVLAVAAIVPLSITGNAVAAATAVPLGTTTTFAVLGASTVTNTGSSTINGDLGLNPGSSVTGFPPGIVTGTVHVDDGVAQGASSDLTTAYNAAAAEGPTLPIVADLGGQVLTPGVYNSASSIGLTGTLTLDAGGDPNAVFVFQAATSTLITASSSQVNLINGAQACNVFWQVGSSATLGTNSSFTGTILASASITLDTGAAVDGRLLASTGAVTLDTNVVTVPTCLTAAVSTTATTTAAAPTATGAGTTAAPTATGAGTPTSAAAALKAAAASAAAAKAAAAKAAATKAAAKAVAAKAAAVTAAAAKAATPVSNARPALTASGFTG